MKVQLIRVDERLIHGQIMSSWVKNYWIKRIILVDDEYVNDEFVKTVLPMSAPSGTKVEIRSVNEVYTLINEDKTDDNTLILSKNLKYIYDLYKLGYKFKQINIGNIGSAAYRKAISKKVYMSEEEKNMCKEMTSKGVYVYLQELPHDSSIDIMTKI